MCHTNYMCYIYRLYFLGPFWWYQDVLNNITDYGLGGECWNSKATFSYHFVLTFTGTALSYQTHHQRGTLMTFGGGGKRFDKKLMSLALQNKWTETYTLDYLKNFHDVNLCAPHQLLECFSTGIEWIVFIFHHIFL